jgi:heat shock protein HslJ
VTDRHLFTPNGPPDKYDCQVARLRNATRGLVSPGLDRTTIDTIVAGRDTQRQCSRARTSCYTCNWIVATWFSSSLQDTDWRLQSYTNGQGGVVTPLPQSELTARFGSDGAIGGSSGCNTYRGPYTLDGEALTFGALATTRMACPAPILDQERAFLAALQSTTGFSLADGRLTLVDETGSTQAVLAPFLIS